MTFFLKLIVSLNLSAIAVAPNFDKSVKTCPKDEVILAKEYLLLESMGRRAFTKAKDSCYKQAKTKYTYKLKTENNVTDNIVFVKSVSLKKVEYNKTYEQHDAFIEATLEDGTKVQDKFRFMRIGKPGGKRPVTGCALYTIAPKKAYVLSSCKASK